MGGKLHQGERGCFWAMILDGGVLVAGSIVMIGGLIAISILFLGATAVVLLRRIKPRYALKDA